MKSYKLGLVTFNFQGDTSGIDGFAERWHRVKWYLLACVVVLGLILAL